MPRVTGTKVQKLFQSLNSVKTLKEPVQLDIIYFMRPIRGTRGIRVRWSTPVWNYIWDEINIQIGQKKLNMRTGTLEFWYHFGPRSNL